MYFTLGADGQKTVERETNGIGREMHTRALCAKRVDDVSLIIFKYY